MCVIIGKPEWEALPSLDVIENCFENNPDGAGFMYRLDNAVKIRKGFMTLQDLLAALETEGINEKHEVIYHFRIATAGSVKPENCHPFPASADMEKLRGKSITTDYGIAHNGILNYQEDKINDLSDTMSFIKDFLSDKAIVSTFHEKQIQEALKPIISGSKFAVMTPYETHLAGDFIEDNGLFYSNTSYKKQTRVISAWWDDYLYENINSAEDNAACKVCGYVSMPEEEDYYISGDICLHCGSWK